MKTQYVVIDGIIGAGKSTLIHKIAEYVSKKNNYQIAIIDEPVEDWKEKGILQKSYESPLTWNFPAQCYFFHSRIMHTRKIMAQNKDAQIYFAERSPYTDQLFWNTQLEQNRLGQDPKESKLLHSTYMDMWKLWTELLPMTPTLFVYLRPSLDACMQRVAERARDCEIKGVSRDYQEALLQQHDAVFMEDFILLKIDPESRVPVLQITTDENFRDNENVLQSIVDRIFETIQQNSH